MTHQTLSQRGLGPPRPFEPSSRLELLTTLVRRCVRDLFRRPGRRHAPREHLQAAIDWLKRAQDATLDGGVSHSYSLRPGQCGWGPSYRETSGYIAETFFDVASELGDDDCHERARRMVEWLCTVQNADGSMANPRYGSEGIIFDTGQVLFGFVRAYRELREQRFLDAARRAAEWLIAMMDGDGAWRRHAHQGHTHTYNARVSWSLLALDAVAPDEDLVRAARRSLDWALAQERNGWFDRCAFREGLAPFTHTIAYAIRGFLESAELLDEPRYREVALRSAEAVLGHVRHDGFIPGQIDTTGRACGRYCCLTGNCQLAIVWLRLYRMRCESRFSRQADKALEYVMSTQDLDSSDLNVRGAIPGSWPIWGRILGARPLGGYTPLAYPNWAAKFFADAMLEKLKVGS